MRAFQPPRGHPALYGIPADVIANWTQVHITTARRWKRGEEPPHAAVQMIELRATGELKVVDLAWHGWRLKDGALLSPNGDSFTPNEIMAGPYWRTLVRAYQAEQRLPRQADWVHGEWVPAAVAE